MKLPFLFLILISTTFANESIYYPLFENITKSEDNQTISTLQQYVKSDYNVHAHEANYFLPLSYRINGTYAHDKPRLPSPIQYETEFQISLKYDVGSNLFGLNESYTVAYTQRSFWQLYVESAYFRESNYNPEVFVTVPVVTGMKAGIKAVRIGFAHQSNGQGGDNERSWNYFYSDIYFQIKYIFIDLKLWYAPSAGLEKYNPDLLNYLGHGQIRFILPYKKHFFETSFRYASQGRGAAELNYSYPVYGRDDLFVYLKAFSGYGESLIDYDNKVNKVGLGFSISR